MFKSGGCLAAFSPQGPHKVVFVYPHYTHIAVDGKQQLAFLLCYKTSFDGGETFGEGKSVLPDDEVVAAVRSYGQNKLAEEPTPITFKPCRGFAKTPPAVCILRSRTTVRGRLNTRIRP